MPKKEKVWAGRHDDWNQWIENRYYEAQRSHQITTGAIGTERTQKSKVPL